nr:hypothetical protein [Lachnospiraceae bacterium]
MPISGIFQNLNIGNQNISSVSVPKETQEAVSAQKDSGQSALANLKNGDSISGKVMSSQGDTVTVELSDKSTMTATVKGGVNLQPGSQVTFMVSSAQSEKLVLNPLFTNTNASPTVESALNNAGLAVNEQNAAMVTTMMEQGMGIGRENLLTMAKDVAANPEINAATIVKLNQMHVEVNETNADMLHTYENMQHRISGAIDDITDSLAGQLKTMTGSDPSGAMKLFDGVLQSLGMDTTKEAAPFLSEDGKLTVPMPAEQTGAAQSGDAAQTA